MWHRAFDAIQFGRAPVIAALHGAVVGGGLELAAATHIRVAERSTYYGLPEGQRGIFLGGGGSVRIARLIGVARVQDLMLTGRTLNAEEGHAAGVTQYLVEDGKGLEKAMELAAKAASNTSTTNFAVLHALPRIFESDPASGLLTESLMAADRRAQPGGDAAAQGFSREAGGQGLAPELSGPRRTSTEAKYARPRLPSVRASPRIMTSTSGHRGRSSCSPSIWLTRRLI